MCSLLCDATFVPWSERMEPYRDDAKQAGKRPARLAGNTVARFSPSCDAPGGTTTLSVAVWPPGQRLRSTTAANSQAIAVMDQAMNHAFSSWPGKPSVTELVSSSESHEATAMAPKSGTGSREEQHEIPPGMAQH